MTIEEKIQELFESGATVDQIMATARDQAKRRALSVIEERISPSVLKKEDVDDLKDLIDAFTAHTGELDIDATALLLAESVRAGNPADTWKHSIILIGTFFKLRSELWKEGQPQ